MSVIHADNNFIPINNNSHLKSVTETSKLCWEPFSLRVVQLPALFLKNIIHSPLIEEYMLNNFTEQGQNCLKFSSLLPSVSNQSNPCLSS